MSKITITVSGACGIGKSTVCAKLEVLLKHLGCQVEWIDGGAEKNLLLEDWSDMEKTPIEIVERVTAMRPAYETFSGQNGWVEVSRDEYDRTKHNYTHRIRRVPEDADGPSAEADGCPTERAVLQRFWRAHGGRAPQIIEQQAIDELVTKHSEWTPQGFAMVDTHRQKFVSDLLALTAAKAVHKVSANSKGETIGKIRFFGEATVEDCPVANGEVAEPCGGRKDFVFAHLEGQAPTGYLMKHSTGPDRGFAWNKDSIVFSEDWERVGLYTEEQLAASLSAANEGYQARAKRWRDSYDTMQRRAMTAEAKVLTQAQIDAIKFAIGYLGNSELSQEMVSVLKTITEKE
jgi:hypothetical protein